VAVEIFIFCSKKSLLNVKGNISNLYWISTLSKELTDKASITGKDFTRGRRFVIVNGGDVGKITRDLDITPNPKANRYERSKKSQDY
jgi:hypothetical protein